MPISQIPIIARTNTIDEWRIQTNKSASDLNDLGFFTYDKDQGTLVLSNTSSLSITAEGTPLQVANNVLFSSSLTLANTLFLGVQSSATGNVIAGGTVSVRGPGKALSVSNNSYVGVNLEVVNSIYTGNVYANNDVTIGDDATIGGTLTLTSTGTVLSIADGAASINLLNSSTIASDNVRTDNLYAAFARVDVLDDLAFARIGILENTTGNSYYLSSNSHNSNTITTRYITANISGNIVNFSSNVAAINTATVLDANIVNQITETLTVNISSTNTATILDGNVVTVISENATVNVATINVSSTNDATVLVGNVVTLTSNDSTLNVATVNTANITWLTSSNTIYANNIITNNVEVSTINAAYVNVSSDVWLQEGSQLRIYAADVQDEVLTVDGKSTFEETYIRGNIAVEGTWTALGNVEYEVSQFTLNARTPVNADATIRNNRIIGDDAFIQWDETDDQWKISKGNTYTSLFGILDASFLNATVTSNSTANVATPSAVKAAYETAQFAGGYANNAYVHANNSYIHANNSYLNSNAAHTMANAAFDRSNNVYSHANSAYLHANASYIQANTTNAHVYGSITTRIDTLEANNALSGKFREVLLLNSNQDQATVPSSSMVAKIDVDRGSRPNASIRWVESQSIDVRVQLGDEIFEVQNNPTASGNWIFTRNGVNYQNVGSQAAESYSNSAYEIANTALVTAESVDFDVNDPNTGTKKRITDIEETLTGLTGEGGGGVTKASNLAGGSLNRIPYQTDTDTTDFILAPSQDGTVLTYKIVDEVGVWAWEKAASALGGQIDGDLTVNGTITSDELEFGTIAFGTDRIATQINTSKLMLNNDIIGQPSEEDSNFWGEIVVYRGGGGRFNPSIRFNEAIDRWQYSIGSTYYNIGEIADKATNVSGGNTNRIVYQTAPNVTGFISAPPSGESRYLNWTGTAYTWADVNVDPTTFRFDASQITTGVLATTRLGGFTPYPISITGSASSADTADEADIAFSLAPGVTVDTCKNVDGGRTNFITTGDFFNSGALENSGRADFGSDVYIDRNCYVDGSLFVDFMYGTAQFAQYADLAEKYVPDENYEIGTLLSIGGEQEVTATTKENIHSIVGAVSENPAYLMNSNQVNGIPVGLKGRINVRVIGKCKKGDLLTISDIPGVAICTDKNELPLRFICLDNKETEEEGLVLVSVI